MRFIIVYIILLFIPFFQLSGQEDVEQENIFYSADFEYRNGNYRKAASYYETLLEKGTKTVTRQLDLVYKLLTRVNSANLIIIGHTD